MREFAFTIFLLMSCPQIQGASAQELHRLKISGVVTDADSHKPLPGVSVTVVGDRAAAPTITDDNGLFILELANTVKAGSDVWVKFEKQGYESRNEHLSASSEVPRTFTLQAKIKQKGKPKSPARDPETRTQPPSENHGTTDTVEERVRSHGVEDTVAAKVMSAQDAFSVAVETRLLVPGPSKETSGTGFWALRGVANNCYLSSVDTALFIRIKNLQPTKVMITAYNVFAIGGELERLKMNVYRPFLILGRGQLPRHSQRSGPVQMPVPSGNLGAFIMFPLKDADPGSASPIEAAFLDNEVSERYLEPGDSARGWAFFQYPSAATIPAGLLIKISDDLGHTFSYKVPDENGNPTGDTLERFMALGPTVDLSSCALQPHGTVLPEVPQSLDEINRNLSRMGQPNLSSAQMDEIREVDQFIVGRDEMALRQVFGFPSMLDINIRLNTEAIRHVNNGTPFDFQRYQNGREMMVDTALAGDHIHPAGGLMGLDNSFGTRVLVLVLPTEYSTGKKQLLKFETSSELPHSVIQAVNEFDAAVSQNAEKLLHILDEALRKDPNYYLRHDELDSIEFVHQIDHTWNVEFIPLRPKADNIRMAIRQFLHVE
ncbi:MAG TPA: carboxypeptidase regulatory-like domain-containing protein [Candidatus Acidoferrum sp.]|nr:carboxypeptidase regulatory-like domain-containing protein [Candidatus Acidoferrum sp.]